MREQIGAAEAIAQSQGNEGDTDLLDTPTTSFPGSSQKDAEDEQFPGYNLRRRGPQHHRYLDDSETSLQTRPPSQHPLQPHFSRPDILIASGMFLLTFGTSVKSPHVLWCIECESVLVVNEVANHWKDRGGTHHPQMPAFDQKAIYKAYPDLVRTISDIDSLSLELSRDHAGSIPLQTQHLPYEANGFFCNECCRGYKTHGSFKSHSPHASASEPELSPLQKLGKRTNLHWFRVSPNPPEPLADAVQTHVLQLYQHMEAGLAQAMASDPEEPDEIDDRGDDPYGYFASLGWTDIRSSLGATYAEHMGSFTKFTKNDPLALLPTFMSNYFAMVASSASIPAHIQVSRAVIDGTM